MAFLVAQEISDSEAFTAKLEAYHRYLHSVRGSLPRQAFTFANAPWHYDFDDHRCPHDAWLEYVRISEASSGDREQYRRIEIHVRLLASFHDGYIDLIYKDVQSYNLRTPLSFSSPPLKVGHGDWLLDEVR